MMGNKSFIFRFSDMEVREREFCLIKGGEVLAVEPKAFRVLLTLLRNPQKLIAKEELLNSVWGDAAVTEGSLTRSIALLRRLLGDDIRNPRYIETVATVGYRFVSRLRSLKTLWEISRRPQGEWSERGGFFRDTREWRDCGSRGESCGADRERVRQQRNNREADS